MLSAMSRTELDKLIDDFGSEIEQVSISSLNASGNDVDASEYPKVSGALGTSAAIMAVLTSPWGRSQPRTESEISEVLKVNAIYFSQGSVSGTLNYLTKNGRLRRLPKGKLFAYTPTAEALVTA